jgi:purine-cytosine permease-like protein
MGAQYDPRQWQQDQPQPPHGHYLPPQPYAPRQQWQQPRKKRRVFLWVFLGIQVLFLVWIIVGAASHPAGPAAAQQAAQQCANGGWQGLFKSQADCNQHYAVALNDAGNVGKGIAAALIVVFWVVTDFFLGLGYLVYKLASRAGR